MWRNIFLINDLFFHHNALKPLEFIGNKCYNNSTTFTNQESVYSGKKEIKIAQYYVGGSVFYVDFYLFKYVCRFGYEYI